MPKESRPEPEPGLFGFEYGVTRLVGSTLITLSELALLWGAGIYVLGYRGFTNWEHFWFVAACSSGATVGYCIFRTVERAEKLHERNATLTQMNGLLGAEVEHLKAKFARSKGKG